MSTQELGKSLQGMGAWFAGKGPQYERVQQLGREEDRQREQEAVTQKRQKALLMANQIRQMATQYDANGAMQAIYSLQEGADPEIAQGLQEYTTLLHESGGNLAPLMRELDNDIAELGGSLERPDSGPTLFSAKTDYLPGGYTKVTDRNGNIKLYGADNIEITDPSALRNAMALSQQYAVDQASGKAKGVEDAKNTSKRIDEYFDKSQNLRMGLSNFDEIVRLIDSGAETGPISDLLPSIKGNTQKLYDLQNRMGLNIISDTTFGALSDSERKMALQTGLPTNMDGPALKDWALTRKALNQKMIDYLDWAASTLDQDGMTLAKFRKGIKNGDIVEPDFGYGAINRTPSSNVIDIDLTQ